MKNRKFGLLCTAMLSASLLLANFAIPTYALTADQQGAISQNCASIKQSLRTLQKADSRMRVLLGTTYQTLLTNFITPLNLRLVKNNQPDTALTELQANFSTTRDQFSKQFINYSQSLEELISLDCKAHPEEFYTKLEQARTRRATLAQTVSELRALIDQHHTAVTQLYNGLKEPADAQ